MSGRHNSPSTTAPAATTVCQSSPPFRPNITPAGPTCHDSGRREGLGRQAAAAVVAVVRRAAHARAAAAWRAIRVVMRRRGVACWPTVAAVAGRAAVPAPPPAVVRRRAAAVPHLGARSMRVIHARPSMVVARRRPVRQGAGAGGHGIAGHRPLDLNLRNGKGQGWAVWRNVTRWAGQPGVAAVGPRPRQDMAPGRGGIQPHAKLAGEQRSACL